MSLPPLGPSLSPEPGTEWMLIGFTAWFVSGVIALVKVRRDDARTRADGLTLQKRLLEGRRVALDRGREQAVATHLSKAILAAVDLCQGHAAAKQVELTAHPALAEQEAWISARQGAWVDSLVVWIHQAIDEAAGTELASARKVEINLTASRTQATLGIRGAGAWQLRLTLPVCATRELLDSRLCESERAA